MVLGSFTLEDMLAQLRMIRRMGPMKKVLGMMPGLGSMTKGLDVDDKQMNRLEALFTSMTQRERLQPESLDMSRRRRVARGAGQDVGAINELLKRFKDMKRMMKQMNKLGLGARMGSKSKQQALRSMSSTGELAAQAPGALSGLFGGGGLSAKGPARPGAGLAGGQDLAGMLGDPRAPRPMGGSATRKRGSKRKDKRKRRKGRKG